MTNTEILKDFTLAINSLKALSDTLKDLEEEIKQDNTSDYKFGILYAIETIEYYLGYHVSQKDAVTQEFTQDEINICLEALEKQINS